MNLKLPKGNHKLSNKVMIFNLPERLTCPGMTPECAKVCYAAKSTRRFPKSVVPYRLKNLEMSKDPAFVPEMIKYINLHSNGFFRWHEDGDVYDQAYLDKIIEIMNACPGTRFLMYTKSFHLDFSKAPANLALYWSTTDSNTMNVPRNQFGMPTRPRAHLVLRGQTPPAGYVTCDKGGLKEHYCCDKCTICWAGTADVYFDQH